MLYFVSRPLGLCLLFCLLVSLVSRNVAAAPSRLEETPNLDTMLGQMIMTGFRGTEPGQADVERISGLIRSGRLGGIILFDRDWTSRESGRNIRSVDQVKRLIRHLEKDSAIPPFIAVDQEGGMVQRLRKRHGFIDTPSAAQLGKSGEKSAEQAGFALGTALKQLGVNLNFAPVVDVAVNADSPAIAKVGRAFSPDPAQVARLAAAFARGQGRSGIISCYKHFPGHGSARTDTHEAFTDITATWLREELIPYRPENRPAVPLAIMTGHLFLGSVDDSLPASLSPAVINGLLRTELSWQGVVISDDMQMRAITDRYGQKEAIRLAVLAGTDIILTGNNLVYNPDAAETVHVLLRQLVDEGALSEARIRESWQRIRALKAGMGGR